MKITEHISLSSLTTLRVGGDARFVAECVTDEDVREAVGFAEEAGLPYYVLGSGSNVLAPDEGYEGVIIQMQMNRIMFSNNEAIEECKNENEIVRKGSEQLVIASAGIVWDEFVSEIAERGLWGIENLAGIPGTVGAAPVQNIGAYGAEAADTLTWVEAFDTKSKEVKRFMHDECALGYRESRFKHDRSLIILRVAFSFSSTASPRIEYKDLRVLAESGVSLATPTDIAAAVRTIRARKFPDLRVAGTAGSFFKNPVIAKEAFDALKSQYPDVPSYPASKGVKVPLAWVLDNVLQLRGHSDGPVRLFENQPLVLVTAAGATSYDVDTFANAIAARVLSSTGITIEREVRILT